eukprot:m51a1_g9376 putative pyrroline-5-carboxylate reductase (301) ;mRNA; f:203654-204813
MSSHSVAAAPSPLAGMKIALIGCGVMGEAILKALLASKAATADQIRVAEGYADRANDIAEKYRVATTTDAAEAAAGADLAVLACKPQQLEPVFASLRAAHFGADALLLSICAGVPIARLQAGTGAAGAQRVVRVMPNTPAQIGEGMSAWACSGNLSAEQTAATRAVLAALGEEVRVADEAQLDMATALSGSGPAYVLLFMEAMIDAGVHMGFPRATAEKLVMQTFRGTTEYALTAGKGVHVAALRNQVTSPGGTTAAALYELERGGMRTVVSDAVWACYRRSQELGKSGAAPSAPQSNKN